VETVISVISVASPEPAVFNSAQVGQELLADTADTANMADSQKPGKKRERPCLPKTIGGVGRHGQSWQRWPKKNRRRTQIPQIISSATIHVHPRFQSFPLNSVVLVVLVVPLWCNALHIPGRLSDYRRM